MRPRSRKNSLLTRLSLLFRSYDSRLRVVLDRQGMCESDVRCMLWELLWLSFAMMGRIYGHVEVWNLATVITAKLGFSRLVGSIYHIKDLSDRKPLLSTSEMADNCHSW